MAVAEAPSPISPCIYSFFFPFSISPPAKLDVIHNSIWCQLCFHLFLSFPVTKPFLNPLEPSFLSSPKQIRPYHPPLLMRGPCRLSRNQRLEVCVAPEAVAAEIPTETETSSSETIQETEKVEVTVKQVQKPRLVLKFIWMEKNVGLALDQVIPGHGTVPLSPYFFWPRKDAWEELKATLESKPWISDIINLWQQSGGNLT